MSNEFRFKDLNDIEDIEKVPCKERIPEKSTYEILQKGAAMDPEAPAITFLLNGDTYENPSVVTHGQLIGRIRQTANMLHDLGVGPADVVTYLLPNIPHAHYVLWGAEVAGIANPVNPMLEAGTIKDICEAARTKVLVSLGEFPGSDIWQKVDSIRGELPDVKHIIRVMGPSDEANGIIGYDEKIESYPADKLTFDREIHPDDIASMYHTGGTTGRPKLAKRSHYNEVVLSWDIAAASALQPGETVMCGLPLFHCNGTCVTGLMPFSGGGNVVLLSPRGYRDETIIKNFWKIVEKYKPVFFSAVPTVLGVLLQIPVSGADISSLRYAVCGAAPLSVELFQRFEQHSGLKILEGYGLTETACASAINPKDGERKVGSIGIRLPYHWVKVAIVDDNGEYVRDAETDEIGTVVVKGPCVFDGYVEDIHNQGIWIDDKKEWFNTGDLGRQDADGFLWLTGRRKELIIRGGHNIDPAVIEEALYKMEGVAVAAAVGRPDAHAGEVPVAYVQVSNPNINEKELMDWARKNIGEKAAVPKEIIKVDTIPLTTVGKIFKPALQWDATKRIYEQELAGLEKLAESVKVSVGEDKVHGTLASIEINPGKKADKNDIETKVQDLLSRYTVKYTVSIL